MIVCKGILCNNILKVAGHRAVPCCPLYCNASADDGRPALLAFGTGRGISEQAVGGPKEKEEEEYEVCLIPLKHIERRGLPCP